MRSPKSSTEDLRKKKVRNAKWEFEFYKSAHNTHPGLLLIGYTHLHWDAQSRGTFTIFVALVENLAS